MIDYSRRNITRYKYHRHNRYLTNYNINTNIVENLIIRISKLTKSQPRYTVDIIKEIYYII